MHEQVHTGGRIGSPIEPPTGEEITLWEGRPSMVLTVPYWFGAAGIIYMAFALGTTASEMVFRLSGMFVNPFYTLVIAPIPIAWAMVRSFRIHSTIYTVTSQRLLRSVGVLSQRIDEVELIRIRDYEVRKPFGLRLLGLGNLRILSADRSTPVVDIVAQRNVEQIRDALRMSVLKAQKRFGYREVETTL